MEFNAIYNISIEYLVHHPKNPRREIGDIEELTESIKSNGIMQNLTIIPVIYWEAPEKAAVAENIIDDKIAKALAGEPQKENQTLFYVLIGNRRFEAAEAAGLETVPVKVVKGLSKEEQVGIMLLENIQRADLTIPEQAKGFQMMIDMGSTVEDLSESTGFSPATIYHRLNIAKLDDALVEDAISKHQLTLTDFNSLEKIKDIDKRNEILKRQPTNISYAVERAIEEEKYENWKRETLSTIQQDYLLSHLPDNLRSWSDGVSKVLTIEKLKNVDFSELPKEQLYYTEVWGGIDIFTYDEEEAKAAKLRDLETARASEERKKYEKELEDDFSAIKQEIKDYLLYLAKPGSLENSKPDADLWRSIWKIFIDTAGYVEIEDLEDFVDNDINSTEEELREKIDAIPPEVQAIMITYSGIENDKPYTWKYGYNKNYAQKWEDFVNLLVERLDFGFIPNIRASYETIINGTHKGYKKEDA